MVPYALRLPNDGRTVSMKRRRQKRTGDVTIDKPSPHHLTDPQRVSLIGPTACQSNRAHNVSVLQGPQRVSLTGPTACQSNRAHSMSV